MKRNTVQPRSYCDSTGQLHMIAYVHRQKKREKRRFSPRSCYQATLDFSTNLLHIFYPDR